MKENIESGFQIDDLDKKLEEASLSNSIKEGPEDVRKKLNIPDLSGFEPYE